MNFDVTQVLEGMENNPPRPEPKQEKKTNESPKTDTPKPVKKPTPVEALQQKNNQYEGARVDHHDKNEVHYMKNDADRDVEEVVKELPNTVADIRNLGNRIARAKIKLGLGEGGFVDQDIEVFNYQTGKVEGIRWATSEQINAEFIAREPAMTDEQLEDFLKSYFVEFDLKTGEVKPRKYPPKPGLKCSVIFPTESVNPAVKAVELKTPDGKKIEYQKQQAVHTQEKPVPEKKEDPKNEMKKIRFKIEERNIGVRKKIDKKNIGALSEMILDRNAVPMTAVASRYKCDVTAVTYEEYDQIRSMVETSTLARETKMWSMIYRHVKNPTIGEFKSFEDFCEKTAWADRQRFWFALMCTMTTDKDTQMITCHNEVFKRIAGFEKLDLSDYKEAYKDIDTLSLLPVNKIEIPDMKIYTIIGVDDVQYKYIPMTNENNPDTVRWTPVESVGECNTTYQVEYYNRSLLDTDKLPSWVEEELNKINDISSLEEALQFHEEGALVQKRIVQLNDVVSVEVGFKSVADVLRKDYRYIVPEELTKTAREIVIQDLIDQRGDPEYKPTDEDIDQYFTSDNATSTLVAVVMCQIIDKVIITDENGEESESDDPAVIVSIIKQCRPTDVAILANEYDTNHLLYRYATSYEPTFSYKKCTCPSCGYVVDVPITDIKDMVFTLSRSLMNTTFDITSL